MSKVVIIGGGVSGVVTAIYSGKNGNDVTILERNPDILKKLLITGNGRCNYFNSDQDINHYHSSSNNILKEIINEENINELLNFYENIGIVPKVKNGYYYPYSNQAVSIKNALKKELEYLKVDIKYNYLVEKINKRGSEFIINDDIICDNLVISTGSKAYPKTGSDGSGYILCKNFNHSISDVAPALTSIKSDDKVLKELSGVRAECRISLYENDKLLKTESGELQLLDGYISGICTFNLSYLVSNNNYVYINFIPFISSKNEFIEYMDSKNKTIKDRTVNDLLEGILNYKIVNVILKKSNIRNNAKYDELTTKEKNTIAKNTIEFKLNVTGVNSFDKAQICKGGVLLSEININTLESKKEKNLYIVGELLDVNGDCGGYNLTFAFISGFIAGRSIK